MNIVVLTGGTSSERNVSYASSKAIYSALKSSGHNVHLIDPAYGKEQPDEEKIFSEHNTIGEEFPTAEALKTFDNRKVIDCINSNLFDNTDIVFIGLHGKFGEDGKIQSLFEMRGVSYTGSGVTASAMAMDKNVTKIFLKYAGVPTPNWMILTDKNFSLTKIHEMIKNNFSYPLVIKPNDEGSTVGLSIIKENEKDNRLNIAVAEAFQYSESVIIEEYIPGKEVTVTILGDEALPIVEIKPKDGFYDYEHKYTSGKTEYICPAVLDEKISESLKADALKAHRALGCKIYSRVDFRLNHEQKHYCLEINTLPGLTELSLVPKAAQSAGLSFPQLLNKIIELSLK